MPWATMSVPKPATNHSDRVKIEPEMPAIIRTAQNQSGRSTGFFNGRTSLISTLPNVRPRWLRASNLGIVIYASSSSPAHGVVKQTSSHSEKDGREADLSCTSSLQPSSFSSLFGMVKLRPRSHSGRSSGKSSGLHGCRRLTTETSAAFQARLETNHRSAIPPGQRFRRSLHHQHTRAAHFVRLSCCG